MEHVHNIYGDAAIFTIDPNTRTITTDSKDLKLVQYDHKSNRYIFQMPRMVNGHDMSMCDLIQIHYDNISKDKKQINHDYYTVDDVLLSSEDETLVTFSWLITRSSTQIVGKLNFSIYFACITSDGETEYAWNTSTFDKVIVQSSIHNNEHLVTEYSDFVERMESIKGQTQNTLNAFSTQIQENHNSLQTQMTDLITSTKNRLDQFSRNIEDFKKTTENRLDTFALQVSDEHISSLINEVLGVIENDLY